jgi:hypothetical protein
MRGIPAVAITSGAPFDLLKRRTHREDSPHDIDVDVLRAVSTFIGALLEPSSPDHAHGTARRR